MAGFESGGVPEFGVVVLTVPDSRVGSVVLARRALKARHIDAGRLIAVHVRAANNLPDAKGELLDQLERDCSLVTGNWVRRVMADHDGAAVALVKALPHSYSVRICPQDPEHARGELDGWVQEVFLKTLS